MDQCLELFLKNMSSSTIFNILTYNKSLQYLGNILQISLKMYSKLILYKEFD